MTFVVIGALRVNCRSVQHSWKQVSISSKPGFEVIKPFSCSTQLSAMKYIYVLSNRFV